MSFRNNSRGGFKPRGGGRSFGGSPRGSPRGGRSFGSPRGGRSFGGNSRGSPRGGRSFGRGPPRGGRSFGGNSRGPPRGGRSFGGNSRGPPRGGARGGQKVIVEPHAHAGVFVSPGKDTDQLCTRNLVPGSDVYGEKRISVPDPEGGEEKIEYRVWNYFRSKLGAALINGIRRMVIAPGSKVLYLGAASGTTVSHVSDIVGPDGLVFAVEFSHRSGRDLLAVAKKRHNIVPIIEDARHPHKYRMIVPMVDVVFADIAQPDQARIVKLNASRFLKNGGGIMIAIKASCVSATEAPEQVFKGERLELESDGLVRIKESITLEPYQRNHSFVIGTYRPKKKSKKSKSKKSRDSKD